MYSVSIKASDVIPVAEICCLPLLTSQVSSMYLFCIFLMHKLVVSYNLVKKKDKQLESVHKGPFNVINIFKFSFRFIHLFYV